MEDIIRFGNLRVKRGARLGGGTQRTVYACDYTFRGKKFVLKRADDGDEYSNKQEFIIYKFVKGTPYAKYFPEFKKMTKDGRWLLVERCVTAKRKHGSMSSMESEEMAQDIFPDGLVHDNHSGNWGYTLKDKRPVILDMAHNDYEFSIIKDSIRSIKKGRKAA